MGIFIFQDLLNSQSLSFEKYSQWTVAVEIYIKLQDVHSSVKPLI